MILEGNFYKIEKIEEVEANTYVVGVEMMPEHPIYAGHFPQQAVVPGVCTLTIIKEIIGKILSREVVFAAIKDFWDAFLLDGRRLYKTELANGLQYLLIKACFLKCCH